MKQKHSHFLIPGILLLGIVLRAPFTTLSTVLSDSSLFLVASSYFMFKEDPDWIMLLTVAAVLQLYTSILIPRVSKKEEK